MNLRSFGITVVSLAGFFVLGILLFNFVIMPLLTHQRESVIVPELRNLSEAQAERELRECARLSAKPHEKVAFVDAANRIRPRTWT